MRSFGMTCMALLSVGALALVGCGDDSGSSGPSGPAIESCLGEFSTLPADFSAAGYAAANADLAAYFCTDGACDGKEECRALADHYVNNGAAEGRGYVPLAPSSSAAAPSSASGNPGGKANRVGFAPYYGKLGADEIDYSRYTHLVLFSATVNADGTVNTAQLDSPPGGDFYQTRMTQLIERARSAGIKLFYTIGGSGRSQNMGTVFADASLRATFVASAVAYAQSKGLQGIDIDWEFPKTDAEDNAMVETLRDLSAAAHAAGLQVSVDIPTHRHIELGSAKLDPAFAQYADIVNVMTYDYATLKEYKIHDTYDMASATMDYWIGLGIPASKMNFGLAMYGRDCTTAKTDGQCKDMSWTDYYVANLNPTNFTGVYKYYFEDDAGRVQKADYIKSHNLAGVLYWEIDHDYPLSDGSFPMAGSTLVTKRYAALWDELLSARGM